ncbi:MAG TPA: Crp/Fnr family transcriptional regulator [Actinomycetota bacterium]
MLDELVRDGLQGGFLFSLPRHAAERLLAEAIRIRVPAGALIYRDGEAPRVIVVVGGLLRVFLSSPGGRQVTVRYVRSGGVAGLVLVLNGLAPTSIQAMTTASVVALKVETLRSLLASEPGVARACAEELTRQLRQALDDISQQAFLSVRQRIARQLLDLASPGRGRHLVVRASQQELADAVGSVREVVTRTLHELRDDGLVATAPGGIVLLDPVGLTDELADGGWDGRAYPEEAASDSSQGTLGASRHKRSRS